MRRTLAVMVAGVALLLAAAPTAAHHAFAAEFDATKPVKLRGKITKMEWVNPHAWMHLAVTLEDGTVENWMIEAGPPGALVRRDSSRVCFFLFFAARRRSVSSSAINVFCSSPSGSKRTWNSCTFLTSPASVTSVRCFQV